MIEAEKNKSPLLSVRKSEYMRVLGMIASSQPSNVKFIDGSNQTRGQSMEGQERSAGRRRKRTEDAPRWEELNFAKMSDGKKWHLANTKCREDEVC